MCSWKLWATEIIGSVLNPGQMKPRFLNILKGCRFDDKRPGTGYNWHEPRYFILNYRFRSIETEIKQCLYPIIQAMMIKIII